MSTFVKIEHIDLFVDELKHLENILFENFKVGLYFYKIKLIKLLIDNNIIFKQKDGDNLDGSILDVLIVCRSNIMLKQLYNDIAKIYYNENKLIQTYNNNHGTAPYIIKLNNCRIIFKTYERELHTYYEDIIIYDDVLDMNKIKRDSSIFRRNGSLMIKSIVFSSYNQELIDLGYHYENVNKWNEELYKTMLRNKKLERILKYEN